MKRSIKSLVKKLAPKILFEWHVAKMLWSDFLLMQCLRESIADKEAHALAKLTFNYHRIEKGLTMPEFRLGFGRGLISEMMADLQQYEDCGFNRECMMYRQSVGVLHEYAQTHKKQGYDLGEQGQQLDAFLQQRPCCPTEQASYTATDFFSHTHDDFEAFSASRHTVRHFAGRVPEQDIISAVKLASSAPQACNRCFTRIHYYSGEKVQQLLALQNGNRGFGHRCEQLLVVTADIEAVIFWEEWHDLQTNAGIFAMNLSYALHYKQVAHCLLNLWRNPATEHRFRGIAAIPQNEIPVLCIACGKAPEHFMVAHSAKVAFEELLTVHPE